MTATLVVAAGLLAPSLPWAAPVTVAQEGGCSDYPGVGEAGNRSEARITGETVIDGDLRCVVLTEASLAAVDFSGSNLAGARLDQSAWSTSRLIGTNLDDTDARNSSFVASDLLGATFAGADLEGAAFSSSVLDTADFTTSSTRSIRVTGSSVRHSDWARTDLRDAVFSGSDISDSDFTAADLAGADLSGVIASVTDFDDANLSDADLSGAVFRNARLSATNFTRADLRGADLRGAQLGRADLTGADLTGARMDDNDPVATFTDATCPDGSAANDHSTFLLGANCNGHMGPPTSEVVTVATIDTTATAAAVVVLDQSTSMGLPDGSGRTRMEAAVDGVRTIVRRLPDDLAVGFVSYGGVSNPCGIVHEIGAGVSTRDAIIGTVRSIAIDPADVPTPGTTGSTGTPTALALERAVELLPPQGARTVVLVSDGQSNCTGDPCAVAQQLVADGIAVTVNTVGFQITDEGRRELECIASATGGEYVDVTDSAELADRIELATRAVADMVAMGDSYASGEGAADFVGEFGEPSKCHRSPQNLSARAVELIRTRTGESLVRVDVTCSGAVTADISNPSTKPAGDGDRTDDDEGYPAQIDGLAQLDPTGGRHVTLSIGGNDALFGKVVFECVLAGLPRGGEVFLSWLIESLSDEAVPDRPGAGCEQRNTFGGYCAGPAAEGELTTECPDEERTVDRGYFTEDYLDDEFGPLLAATYDSITDRLAEVQADWVGQLGATLQTTRPITVWVSTYPLIFPDVQSGDPSCNWIGSDDLIWINRVWRQANEVIGRAVTSATERNAGRADLPVPVRFALVDIEDALEGHRLCEAEPGDARATAGRYDGVWVNGIAKRNAKDEHERPYWFHPNEFGHRAMGDVLARRMLGLTAPERLPASIPRAVSVDVAAVDDTDIRPGGLVSVTAGPFESGTTAYVAVASEPTLLAEVELSVGDTLRTEVQLPTDLDPGEHQIIVFAENAAGFASDVRAPITVNAPPQPSTVPTQPPPKPPAAERSDVAAPSTTIDTSSAAPQAATVDDEDPSNLATWLILLGAVLLVAALAAGAVMVRRRPAAEGDSPPTP